MDLKLTIIIALSMFFYALADHTSSKSSVSTPAEVTSTTLDPIGKIRHLLPLSKAKELKGIEIIVQVGTTAFLPCQFVPKDDQKITDDQVSWFRRRDWHILTAGIHTYTNDARFTVLHKPESFDWTLQIKYTTSRDNGTYECQLSTGTGVTSQFVNLQVVTPKAVILGNPDYHVQLGSTIKLVCVIEQSPTPPQYIFWYHNDVMINYDNTRGGINVTSKNGLKSRSFLTITDANYKDSGNYTCFASNTEIASVNVFVSYGDKMAAIQRRKSTASDLASLTPMTLVLVALATVAHKEFLLDLARSIKYTSDLIVR